MKIVGAGNHHWLAIKNARLEPQPFWGYEDIGAFLLLAVLLGLILRLLVHLQVLSRYAMDKPSIGLQSAVVTLLGAGLYFILRPRHRQPVLKPLGWVVPKVVYIVTAVIVGPSAKRESGGTGFCDASVLQGPTTWNTMDRLDADLISTKVDIVPFEAEQLAHS
ncbi:MAG TPA: hypothetical protein VF011_06255 [Terriglobales bacterium]